MQKFTDADLDKYLLYVLRQHIGKEGAIERWTLVETIFGEHVPAPLRNDDHPQDRDIRYSVGRLRKSGHFVCDLGNGHGRYLAANKDEWVKWYIAYTKPFAERHEVALAQKKAALKQWPDVLQYSLFDVEQLEAL